jgi:hypothetical protein
MRLKLLIGFYGGRITLMLKEDILKVIKPKEMEVKWYSYYQILI